MSNYRDRICSDVNFIDFIIYQIGSESCSPTHMFGPHVRKHYFFHYVFSGRGKFIVHTNDSKNPFINYEIGPDEGFLIVPDQITTYIADENDPWSYGWFEFDGLRAHGYLAQAGLSEKNPIYRPNRDSENYSKMHSTVQQTLRELVAPNNYTMPFIMGKLYLLLDVLIRTSASAPKYKSYGNLKDMYVNKVIEYIQLHYMDDIAITDISEWCGLNRSYMSKIFRDVMQTSIQDFLIDYRLCRACDYLLNTDLNMADIARETGFSNQMNFSRMFHKHFDISPTAWRKQNVSSRWVQQTDT